MAAAVALVGCTVARPPRHDPAVAARVLPRRSPDASSSRPSETEVYVRAAEITQTCEAFPPVDAAARRWVAARLSNGGLSPTPERIDAAMELMEEVCSNPTGAARAGF